MSSRSVAYIPPNRKVVDRRTQIEHIMWGRRAAWYRCGDDLVYRCIWSSSIWEKRRSASAISREPMLLSAALVTKRWRHEKSPWWLKTPSSCNHRKQVLVWVNCIRQGSPLAGWNLKSMAVEIKLSILFLSCTNEVTGFYAVLDVSNFINWY